MIYLFKSELKKIIKNKLFYISFILILLCIMLTIYKKISIFGYNYDWLYIFLSTHGYGINTLLPIVLPVIVCIPYTSTFFEDINNNYINFVVIRSSLKKYLLVKIFFNMLVPTFLIGINIFLSYIFSSIFFKNPIQDIQVLLENTLFRYAIDTNIFLFIGLILFISIIFSCIFTSIGLLSSLYIKNKYASVSIPFMFYIITGIIGLSIDKIYLHLGTIFTGYLYDFYSFIISLIIGLLIIIACNTLFYLKILKKGL